MNIFRKKNIKGITLVETIVYVALFSIVMSTLVSFGFLLSALNTKNLIIREANANSRNILNFINNQIEYAQNVVSPIIGASSSTLVYFDQDNIQKEIFLKNNSFYFLSNNELFEITRDNILFSDLLFRNLSSDNSQDSIQFSFNYSSQTTSTREFYYENNLKSSATRRF